MGKEGLLQRELVICTKYGIADAVKKRFTGFSGGLELIHPQTPPQDNKAVVMFNGN